MQAVQTVKSARNRAYTLIEILVTSVIMVIIGGVIVLLLRHHVNMMQEGKRSIELQHEVQRVLKQISNDFRRVNSPVVIDQKFNIWLGGEDLAELEISPVELIDADDDITNGTEELIVRHYRVDPLGEERVVRYYLDETLGGMIREENGEPKLFSDRVTELKFMGDKEDLKKVYLTANIVIPETEQTKEKQEQLEAVFRLKSDFIVVKQ